MYQPIHACRICKNPRLETILDLGCLAHTGVFPRPGTPVSAGPLELVQCRGDRDACGLVQLRHSFDPNALYGHHYGYRSSLNQSMVRHLKQVVKRAQTYVALQPGDLVLDIGSNDGTTLSLYGRTDLDLVGIDPCGEKFARYYEPHVRLIRDFFSAERVQQNVGKRQARIITSIAMFYDLEAPLEFVKQVHELLADDGIWIFEQSYLPAMLEQTSYDTICHEHLEYYALRQIQWMTERAGLKIVDVILNDVNGGSIQVIAARQEAPFAENSRLLQELLAQEEMLRTSEVFNAFRDRTYRHRDHLHDFLIQSQRQGRKTLGYGASTKGNVLLQYCGLNASHIPCIAEVNEDKFGCETPGTHIPIVSEAEARAQKPDCYLVLPWHFRDSILQREQSQMAQGVRFLFPLPKMEVAGSRWEEKAA